MQSRIDRHTRLVAWAKITLPIIALGLLSTLFLLSRSVDPGATIPFSEDDLAERTENQQISNPQVFGVTHRGDLISLRAAHARQDTNDSGQMEARDASAQIKLSSGQLITLSASIATHDTEAETITLAQGVTAVTTTGYNFATPELVLHLSTLMAASPGPLTGEGPGFTFQANQMTLKVPKGEKDAHILLMGGVKLVYTPPKDEE
ncbi:LPS export ABC transporter periplasmic protein LptC [uncultured Lentibacter sp.]|jgi:lipopolysaccharide export system protein LptC|uniref:LPS export ABC transporter periplasmic protein LptC n=1 Tax=uncultured Lentibacter sp. TaxID=1659309 RepID=UPI002609E029|nr:LPS export ABC transporter periplasmic protein LptC [uncultured Lentibacter sp.]